MNIITMDDPFQEDISFNFFIHQYYWALVLVVVLFLFGLGLLLWYMRRCRREPRYEYTALADESFLHDRLEMDRKLQRDSDRNMSTIRCQYYLRGSTRYVFLRHLPDMGSRLDKNWYLVRDSTTKTERLLTMTPMAESCPIKYTAETRQVLLDLFLALQHPYIYPVLDIDRKIVMEQEYVIAVLPFNDEGSLKDVIYQSHCQDDWKEKYHFQGYGLSSSQIQRLGCQILEALLFLKDQRFPPFLHLHSGNVIVQNGVARISGLENTLFGYSSRCHLFIPKRLYENKEAVEVICFGHLLFEMATGYELTSTHPSEKNYKDVEDKPHVIDVLKFIFEQGRYRYPSLQQVASLDFFRHIDLRELRSLMPVPSIKAKLSPAARSILKEVKRHQRSRRQSKRSQSMHALETESADGRDSRSSGNSSRSYKKKKKRTSLTSTETTPDDASGTPLQTMPLSSIEGSMRSAPSLPESLDYFTPPTTPQTAPKPATGDARVRSLLLQEIQSGFKLKSVRNPRNPEV
ncbi:slowpoke-binding protein-like [Argiope bruennichi]|uniref:Slowpoke-binding protein like n=1 Tax=Argiope bruennichi TaxID=94029 RepID=A0A8T0EDB3_ARGBR|nr:slowpoke-binding protein-like [Argiope bruennichi]KAF8770623.1 Slowpoke-binding protein like [Argiope bruennichi]